MADTGKYSSIQIHTWHKQSPRDAILNFLQQLDPCQGIFDKAVVLNETMISRIEETGGIMTGASR
jgi:hypothetical protein